MAQLLDWLSSLPPKERDAEVERYLGIAGPVPSPASPGQHLLGYHPSGVAAIVQAFVGVPVMADDIVIDLGAGLGKVVMLARLLTGATARGIEIQQALVERARRAAARLGIDVGFTQADARDADLADGTVFFLYSPFEGPVLSHVLGRLHAIAIERPIVVCALGIDLERNADWLSPRPSNAFWLTIYDSVVPGIPPRSPHGRSSLEGFSDAIVFERV
jgi:hypothetical protein